MFSPIPKLLKIPDPDPDPGSPIPITRLIDRVIGLDRADRAIPINDRGRSDVYANKKQQIYAQEVRTDLQTFVTRKHMPDANANVL